MMADRDCTGPATMPLPLEVLRLEFDPHLYSLLVCWFPVYTKVIEISKVFLNKSIVEQRSD